MYAVVKIKNNKIISGIRKNSDGVFYENSTPAVFTLEAAKQIALIPRFKSFKIVPFQEVINQTIK